MSAPFGGTVDAVLVHTGEAVEAGQVLVRFRSTEFDTRMQRILTSLDHVRPAVIARAATLVRRIPPKVWHQIEATDPQLLAAEQEYVDALFAFERKGSLAAKARLDGAISNRREVQRRLAQVRPEVLELFCRHYFERAEDLKWLSVQRTAKEVRAPFAGSVEIIDLHVGDVISPQGRVALLAFR